MRSGRTTPAASWSIAARIWSTGGWRGSWPSPTTATSPSATCGSAPTCCGSPDADTGEESDILILCPQGIDSRGDEFRNIFACGYLVGHLDGTTFTPTGEFTELDSGFEFYAPQVFTVAPGEPEQPPLLVGWLGNASEDCQPSLTDHGWVHALSVPRDLTLRGGRLHQQPRRVAGEPKPVAIAGTNLAGSSHPVPELDGVRSFVLDLAVDQSGPWSLRLGKSDGAQVGLSFERGALTVDRSATRHPQGDVRRLATLTSTGSTSPSSTTGR